MTDHPDDAPMTDHPDDDMLAFLEGLMPLLTPSTACPGRRDATPPATVR